MRNKMMLLLLTSVLTLSLIGCGEKVSEERETPAVDEVISEEKPEEIEEVNLSELPEIMSPIEIDELGIRITSGKFAQGKESKLGLTLTLENMTESTVDISVENIFINNDVVRSFIRENVEVGKPKTIVLDLFSDILEDEFTEVISEILISFSVASKNKTEDYYDIWYTETASLKTSAYDELTPITRRKGKRVFSFMKAVNVYVEIPDDDEDLGFRIYLENGSGYPLEFYAKKFEVNGKQMDTHKFGKIVPGNTNEIIAEYYAKGVLEKGKVERVDTIEIAFELINNYTGESEYVSEIFTVHKGESDNEEYGISTVLETSYDPNDILNITGNFEGEKLPYFLAYEIKDQAINLMREYKFQDAYNYITDEIGRYRLVDSPGYYEALAPISNDLLIMSQFEVMGVDYNDVHGAEAFIRDAQDPVAQLMGALWLDPGYRDELIQHTRSIYTGQKETIESIGKMKRKRVYLENPESVLTGEELDAEEHFVYEIPLVIDEIDLIATVIDRDSTFSIYSIDPVVEEDIHNFNTLDFFLSVIEKYN